MVVGKKREMKSWWGIEEGIVRMMLLKSKDGIAR